MTLAASLTCTLELLAPITGHARATTVSATGAGRMFMPARFHIIQMSITGLESFTQSADALEPTAAPLAQMGLWPQ